VDVNVETAGTGAPCLFPTQQQHTGGAVQPLVWPRGRTLGAPGAEIKESRRICLTESLFLLHSLVFSSPRGETAKMDKILMK